MQIEFSKEEVYEVTDSHIKYNFPYPRIRACNIKNNDSVIIEEMNLTDWNFPFRQFKCIEIMKHIDHENILNGFSVHFKDEKYYFVRENLLCSMNDVIYSNCPLENIDVKLIIYQVLQGLLALHSIGILHNHICPDSIWVNEEIEVKLSDFSFAAEVNKEYNDIIAGWETYAPEIIFNMPNITGKADIWSCGCLLYELVTRKPIFSDFRYNALKRIIEKIGMPDEDDMYFLEDKVLAQLWSLKQSQSKNIVENDDTMLVDLLRKMLVFNPSKRWDAEKCLQHPYFEEILEHFPTQLNFSYKPFDWNLLKEKIPRDEILALINLKNNSES